MSAPVRISKFSEIEVERTKSEITLDLIVSDRWAMDGKLS